ncbi:MAG: helicase-exonuclease AddAB subunit AddA [Oscillospiraceae bacterium]|nr:helicase-exonuclease AddAB subunit AddA [Oscillospiraceae bacterium]
MAEIKLTGEQRSAVDDRGGDLLVSAAAGSGKTRVLVERLMAYVEQGEDIDRFLVITFTNAAAAELRMRIAGAIHRRLGQDPGNRHLRRNASLIYKAPICTIDAFCIDFLRQWGHLEGLDPDFRLCDQAEGEELRRQALEEVLERRYAGAANDPGFEQLVDALAGERDDRTLESVILSLHDRVQAQTDPRRWLLSCRENYDLPEGTKAEDTPWGRLLMEDGRELARYWLEELEELHELTMEDELLSKNYAPSLEGTLDWLGSLVLALNDSWDSAAACFPAQFPALGRKRGECDEALKERVAEARKRCKKQLDKLGESFGISSEQAMEDVRAVAPAICTLLEVTEEFDRAFEKRKRRGRLVDFADCEHITARLLTDEQGRPTRLALELQESFTEIMVDEYQDTNAVQNAIFGALSNGRNLFMVGDVKQSIYRFRLADPTRFLEKYETFAPGEEAAEGEARKLLLSSNFRSRPEVLDAVNFIFRNVMTKQAGELDYTEAEALKAGREDLPPDGRYRVELDCVDLSAFGDEEEKADKDEAEAAAVAQRIREVLDSGLMVGDHPVTPRDIVILLRSPGPVLRHYAYALDCVGVPWSADGGYEFFGTTEVSVAIAMLQIVDNPRQDVPLLAVLRSPLFGFDPDRLAHLRSGSDGSVYDCMVCAAERGEEDCKAFLELLEELRDLAAEEGSHTLLWHIYERTDMPAVFFAMPEGARRRANLMALHDEACRFESGGHRGAMAFLAHLSRMAENGLTVPVKEGGSENCVRIMSIHRSKGLEFPVVFLCGLERQFNMEDTRSAILFHPELGLGFKRVDRSRMLRYTTVTREAVALRLKREMRSEEMRLLYVAMTRAEHKLFLFAAVNGRQISLKAMAQRAQCPPPPYLMANAGSMAEWVLSAALCRGDSTALWRDLDVPRPENACGLYPWDIRLVGREDPAEELSVGGGAENGPEEALSLPEDLRERFGWTYPNPAAVNIPSKLTATQLKGREKDREAAEEGVPSRPETARAGLRTACFGVVRPLTPAQKGTALHMVMEYLRYDRTGSREEIAGEIARLVAERYITPQQGECVDPEVILHFFRSETGQRLRSARRVEREFKFSLLVSAAQYYPEAGGLEDEVLLQGVVDCWFEDEKGAVTVLDFKTDRVSEDTVAARAEEYRGQLEAYTRALGEVLGKKVEKKLLWFFSVGDAVEI